MQNIFHQGQHSKLQPVILTILRVPTSCFCLSHGRTWSNITQAPKKPSSRKKTSPGTKNICLKPPPKGIPGFFSLEKKPSLLRFTSSRELKKPPTTWLSDETVLGFRPTNLTCLERSRHGDYTGTMVTRHPAFISWYGKFIPLLLLYRQGFENIPGGCLGFLNHQQYYKGIARIPAFHCLGNKWT